MGRCAPDVAFVWRAVLTLGLVLLYYCFSIGITFYNKWLTKSFHFPLFMTMLHLAVIFLFSALSRALVQCSSHRARVVLSWPDYLRRVAPTALATALDVGLSNWSFLYITVSLYTMTKSSAVLFILIFSLIFKLEELRAALVLVVLLIAGGLFMFTYKSTQFNIEGFALVLGASFIGGIRWTLTQMLLQKAELGLQNPIDTMFHLQPLMFLGLFPLFAVFEGHRAAPAGVTSLPTTPWALGPTAPLRLQGSRPRPEALTLFYHCSHQVHPFKAEGVGYQWAQTRKWKWVVCFQLPIWSPGKALQSIDKVVGGVPVTAREDRTLLLPYANSAGGNTLSDQEK